MQTECCDTLWFVANEPIRLHAKRILHCRPFANKVQYRKWGKESSFSCRRKQDSIRYRLFFCHLHITRGIQKIPHKQRPIEPFLSILCFYDTNYDQIWIGQLSWSTRLSSLLYLISPWKNEQAHSNQKPVHQYPIPELSSSSLNWKLIQNHCIPHLPIDLNSVYRNPKDRLYHFLET